MHVFAPGPAPAQPAATTFDGATVHWLRDRGAFGWPGALARLKERPSRWLGVGEFCVRANRALRLHAPFTRVQAHFLVPCAWPLALSVQPTAELELVGHGSDVRLFCRLPNPLRKRIARTWLARRAALRVTSTELAGLLRDANPELAPALRVEPSPLSIAGVPTRQVARRVLGLDQSQSVALIVGRLVSEKRVALALKALSLLDQIAVVVVGDGPELSALRLRFPHVHFTGFLPRPDALRWIAAADVLVSASAHEGAPSVVREARALGVPVVAVAVGDLAEWAKADRGILLL